MAHRKTKRRPRPDFALRAMHASEGAVRCCIEPFEFGKGGINRVCQFSLRELQAAVSGLGYPASTELLLRIMIDGRPLGDIADLPLDLAVR